MPGLPATLVDYCTGRDAAKTLRCDQQKTLPALLGPPHGMLLSGIRYAPIWRRDHVLAVWQERFPSSGKMLSIKQIERRRRVKIVPARHRWAE
jgi:hypothetical protein